MALEGGCRWIQLRMKDTPVDEVEREAIRLQGLCKDYGATFIIDDHVELVKKIHADGVHLGICVGEVSDELKFHGLILHMQL